MKSSPELLKASQRKPLAEAVAHRVRWSMYLILGLVAALGAWQTYQIESAVRHRLKNEELQELLHQHHLAVERMGRHLLAQGQPAVPSLGLVPQPRASLATELKDDDRRQLRLNMLLLDPDLQLFDFSPSLETLYFNWQRQRQKVWPLLAQKADEKPGANDRSKAPSAVMPKQSRSALNELHALNALVELDVLLADVSYVSEQVRYGTQQRAIRIRHIIHIIGFMVGLVVLALVVFVAEPLVRMIKNQHRKQQDLYKDFMQLALVAQRTQNWVLVTDPNRNVVWCNEAFLKSHGQSYESVLGKPPGYLNINRHNSEEDRLRRLAELDRGLSVRAELMHRLPNGQEVWVDVDYQPFHDEQGALLGFTVVATDITPLINERLRSATLMKALPAGVLMQDVQGNVVECNSVAAALLGVGLGESADRKAPLQRLQILKENLQPCPMAERPFNKTLQANRPLQGEVLGLMSAPGQLRWVLVNTDVVRDPDGNVTHVVSCMLDVTEYRDQQQLLTLAIDSASLGVWQWDLEDEVVRCNPRLMSLIGHPEKEPVLPMEFWNQLIHPEDLQGLRWAIRTNLKDSERPLHWEARLQHSSGRWMWCMFSGTVVARDAEGQALRMAGIVYDINVHKDLEEQLRSQAHTDMLTQLPNRVELLNRVEMVIDRVRQTPDQKFALLFMDFDRFKQVNDTLGHNVGDELLRQIARRIEGSLRPGDAMANAPQQIAARLGGDEFVVLLNHMRSDADAERVATRLLEVLSEPYDIGPHRVRSTASIGIVTTEHMSEDADSMLRDADIAMYEAKRQGRGCYVMFHPGMRRRIRDDVALENDLRLALELNQMYVVYQPVVDLNTRNVSGLEALVRWKHPERGIVSPMSFIPVAEACGLINAIGLFVLEQACADLKRMRLVLAHKAPEFMSVNLSRAQLRQPQLIDQVHEVMQRWEVKPEHLILEVTESLAAQDEGVKAALNDLRGLGIALSLDDFGTGYSSLSCLHELPVNIVKIDRSFVVEAMESDFHRVMIEATMRMANTLNLSTVAEGIEHEDQAELMRLLGLQKGQGYLFSKPLPLAEMIDFLDAQVDKAGFLPKNLVLST